MVDIENLIYLLSNFDQSEATAINKVEVAQKLLGAVIDLLTDVVKETNDKSAEAYVVDHLKVIASGNHGFLSNDMNLDDWIEHLECDD